MINSELQELYKLQPASTMNCLVIVCLISTGLLLRHPWRPRQDVRTANCDPSAGTTLYLGAETTAELLRTSAAIVYGEPVGPGYRRAGDSRPPTGAPAIVVHRVLQGTGLRAGQTIRLCPYPMPVLTAADNSQRVIAFLAGQEHGMWVPLYGGSGVILADKAERFDLGWVVQDEGELSVDDLIRLIDSSEQPAH
jgi:hypothetical protein